jgi:hypothetical protein
MYTWIYVSVVQIYLVNSAKLQWGSQNLDNPKNHNLLKNHQQEVVQSVPDC